MSQTRLMQIEVVLTVVIRHIRYTDTQTHYYNIVRLVEFAKQSDGLLPAPNSIINDLCVNVRSVI